VDLLVGLLASMFNRGYPPDVLSQEWDDNDRSIIRLDWYTGHRREYAYTKARFEAAMQFFNEHWHERLRLAA